MKPVFFLLSGVFTILACNNSTGKNEQEFSATSQSIMPEKDSVIKISSADSVPQNIQIDSVIYLAFAPNSFSIAVKGHLDKRGDPVVCYLPVTLGKKLTASVVPSNKKATIRFSHIHLPNGKSDGPFGNTLKYDLKQKGTYKLYIAANMMAGDPVSSDFNLKVQVE